MECSMCKIEKLPNEFAPETISNDCRHPVLFCLRCTIGSVRENSKCPHPDCNVIAALSDRKIQFFQSIVDELFKEYQVEEDDDNDDSTESMPSVLSGGSLTVSLLTGESMTIAFKQDMEILDLKHQIEANFDHDILKQKLIYNGKELKDVQEKRAKARLTDYGVKPNSTVNLIVLLYALPDNLNNVVFDIGWDFPSEGNQYLDAIAFFYSENIYQSFSDYGDYRYRDNTKGRTLVPGVHHTGDVWDCSGRKGHQTIYIDLKDIPKVYTHMFIVVSAYEGSLIRFPHPRLRFYEKCNPSEDLCKTDYKQAFASNSVIMCYMVRKYSRWELFESGQLCGGTYTNHDPMRNAIKEFLEKGN